MEPSKADAIAQAILTPDAKVQEALRRQREAEARDQARRRMTARYILPAMLLGAIVAEFIDVRFTLGILYGAIVGALIAGAVSLWRKRQPANAPINRESDTTS